MLRYLTTLEPCTSVYIIFPPSLPPSLSLFLPPSLLPSLPPQVGTNDRKKQLALKLIEDCGPILVTGRLVDIYTLGQMVQERSEGSGSDGSSSLNELDNTGNTPNSPRKASEPTLSVSRREKWKYREASSHPTMTISPPPSPRASPRGSPRDSPLASPVISPRHIPTASPAGVRKKILVTCPIS